MDLKSELVTEVGIAHVESKELMPKSTLEF